MTPWKTIAPLILIGAGALGTLAGCTKAGPDANYLAPGASQGDEPPPTPPTKAQRAEHSGDLDDRQILGILTRVDAAEIEQARVALTRAADPRVKQFAAHMVDQHTESTQQASSLASQYDLMPAASSEASALQDKGKETKSALDEVTESAFDATYMNAQIQQHQELLSMLGEQLLPSAHNEALAAQLRAANTMVQNHLSEAREIMQQLQPAPAGSTPAKASTAKSAGRSSPSPTTPTPTVPE